MADGTRTHDHLDHNQGLYQLSYSHHARTQDSGASAKGTNAASAGSAGARRNRSPVGRDPRQIIMAARSAAGFAAGVRLGGFEPPTRGLEGRRSVH